MHAILRLVAFCVAAALAGCSIEPIIFTGVEDCEVAGDEDGNGQADCADPACAAAAACRPVCGDGVSSGPEQCDDGNLVTETACPYGTASCTLCNATCSATLALAGNVCGDDDLGGPEQCDDGNLVTETACPYGTASCTLCNATCSATLALSGNVCGDGVSSGPEQCDDGNLVTETACPYGTASCTLCNATCSATLALSGNVCGDNVPGGPELCDDGNLVTETACPYGTASCTLCNATCSATLALAGNVCGDGVPGGPEQCDDGNLVTETACPYGTASCTLCNATCSATLALSGNVCGDGVPGGPEQCDDGNLVTETACPYGTASCTLCNATCSATLALTGNVCGDGVPGGPEQCDDGNLVNDDGCDNDCTISTSTAVLTYVKASNTGAFDHFYSVAMSADGSTLAVGAFEEDSAASGINGDQTSNAAASSGAVYVFTRTGTTWSQQAYVKASNTGAGDLFGMSLALSADGSTLAVGAYQEDSAATGINGDQTSNGAVDSGAVYVFTRTGTTWSQQAYVKASNTDASDLFGYSVALSADGSTLAVGAYSEDSAATGINGDQTSNGAANSGAVYVFTRTGTTWSQQAYVKASNTGNNDSFGISVALSADGSTLAVAAPREDSTATGINGDQTSNGAVDSGAVYVFTRTGTTWSQQAYVKASNTGNNDSFGISVALSADGSTLAVGAYSEDSAATGINGDQTSNAATDSGAAYVFTRTGTTWSQQAYVKASNTGVADFFGYTIALSADGSTLAVGAPREDSAATGINGDQISNGAVDSGAVYVFTRTGTTWSQQAYVKASNTSGGDFFGHGIPLSVDGSTLAVGAYGEASAATGINGDQTSDAAAQSGAAYVYSSL